MRTLRHQQQIARALLVHGVSGEIRVTEANEIAVVLDDPRQLVKVTALMAKHFPGATRVFCPIV
ncbi:MAG TPA: hypothetical protein VF534_01325 [Paraburkholderia sp.]